MTPAARIAAAIDILDSILGGAPAEKTLTTWARQNRFAGSGDRAAIRDHVYDALRQRRSCAWLGGAETGRGLLIGLLRKAGDDPAPFFTGAGYAPPALSETETRAGVSLDEAPPDVALDCPDWLWPRIAKDIGGGAEAVMTSLQSRAPVFLRVNAARAGLAEAQDSLRGDGIETAPHALSPTALEVLTNPRRVQQSRAYLQGMVELQDAASQALVDLILPLCRGKTVLDYCAGGGGKSLALAAGGARDVTAHDVDPKRMTDIPARAGRAGTPVRLADRPQGLFDLVLCDAPCSGSGAWRRQPEAKWRLTPERLDDLTGLQAAILSKARDHVASAGYLAYATCSLLAAENEAIRDDFLTRNPDWRCTLDQRFSPLDGGDGFFIAVFRRSAAV